MEIELELSNHIDCLSREKVRASLVVNLGYAQRINCFLEFQEVLRGNEAHNFRSGGIHDQDADTRPWITDTCAASMALKASSSISIKCHILPKLTLLTSWIVDDLPRQRNLTKENGYKKNLVSWCKLFSTRQTKNSTRQTKTKSRKMQQSSDSRRLKLNRAGRK